MTLPFIIELGVTALAGEAGLLDNPLLYALLTAVCAIGEPVAACEDDGTCTFSGLGAFQCPTSSLFPFSLINSNTTSLPTSIFV